MKHLFVVGHGAYTSSTGKLIPSGRLSLVKRSLQIRHFMQGNNNLYLLSSSAPWAYESAEILKDELCLSHIETRDDLWYGPRSPFAEEYGTQEDSIVAALVEQRKNIASGLILVSGPEVVKYFPSRYIKQKELPIDLEFKEPKDGEMIYLNLISNDARRLNS